MAKDEIKDRITRIFQNLFPAASKAELDLFPRSLTDGKLYEAYIVGVVSENLVNQENLELTLVNGNYLHLKSSPGPINRNYPHIDVSRAGSKVAEIWTDIEYMTLSFYRSGATSPQKGYYHELDIVVVEPNLTDRPLHRQIWLGVECKNLEYEKRLLREILGVRRELSLLTQPKQTSFRNWPNRSVPADPPSCLLVYSSRPGISEYSEPGREFGIEFIYKPLPG